MVIACGMLSLGMLASCGNGEKSKTEGMMNVQCFESDMMSAVASAPGVCASTFFLSWQIVHSFQWFVPSLL